MAIIEVVSPTSRKRAIKCADCALAYSAKDYKVLYQNKKLIFFKFVPPKYKRAKIYCHDCVLQTVAAHCGGKDGIKLKIIDVEYEYDCNFFPSELEDDDDGSSLFDDIF